MVTYLQTLPKELRDVIWTLHLYNELNVVCSNSDQHTKHIRINLNNRVFDIRFTDTQLKKFLSFITNNKNYIDMSPSLVPFCYNDNVIDMIDSALIYSNKTITLVRIDDNRFRNVVSMVKQFTFNEIQTEILLIKLREFL